MDLPNTITSLGTQFTRRGFSAATSVFLLATPQQVRGVGPEKLKAGIVGLGRRGRQAVADLLIADANVELHTAADLFEDQLDANLAWLRDANRHPKLQAQLKVTPETRFSGFNAFEKVMASDCHLVLLTVPPGYAPQMFEAAVKAGKHVFCEKPFGTDPVGVRRFMAAAKESESKKLTVVSGAQRRFQKEYVETVAQIQQGKVGEIRALSASWLSTPVVQQAKARGPKVGDMEWQHRTWMSQLWLGGDQVVEEHIHNIDVCNWVMGNQHPVKVVAMGGCTRPPGELRSNIYDHLSAEFEYANGVRLSSSSRQFAKGLYTRMAELVVGSKGQSNCRDLGTRDSVNPYVAEQLALTKSIRGSGPYVNHAMAVAESTMTCLMARESAYSGLEITWDQIMASTLDLQPKALALDAKVPEMPFPVPGEYRFR